MLAGTAKQISKILTDNLAKTRLLSTSVQGFKEYNFLGYPCRTPLQLNNILGPTFWRIFHPVLTSAIDDIKTSSEIDKNKLHAVLLEKYLGIKDVSQSLDISEKPNAFLALPSEKQDDYLLHINFLQPFRLFGITEVNRKFINKGTNSANREWLWNATSHDSAPLFRKIIKIYILSSILEDYEDPKADPLLKNDLIKNNLDNLRLAHKNLLKHIEVETRQLFQAYDSANDNVGFKDSPDGLLSHSDISRDLDGQFPGFMDMMGLYAIGRLLFGQPIIDSHHAAASQNLNSAQGKWAYAFAWVFVHLNISTSYFWVKTAFSICAKKWKVLKDYVTNPNASFATLFVQSLFFIPNALILASAPLLILLPAIYGLTSIPFTLLRSFCMHGPWKKLKSFNLLKGLDILEFIKDCFLFFVYAVPILNIIVGTIVGLLPAAVVTAGYYTACTALILLYLLLTSRSLFISYDQMIEFSTGLASTFYMQFFGSSVFVGIVAYLGVGAIGRVVLPYLPQFVFDGLNRLYSPINSAFATIERLVRKWVGEHKINLQHIIPQSDLQAPIEMPKAQVKVEVPEKMLEEIKGINDKLGILNRSIHFSPERKKLIKQCMDDLDSSKATSLESLNEGIKKAKTLLENNFDASEAQIMSKLMAYLKEKKQIGVAKENASITQNGKNSAYQPSWNMLKTLHDEKMIDNEGQWHLPEDIKLTIPSEMINKCKRIEAMKPK